MKEEVGDPLTEKVLKKLSIENIKYVSFAEFVIWAVDDEKHTVKNNKMDSLTLGILVR